MTYEVTLKHQSCHSRKSGNPVLRVFNAGKFHTENIEKTTVIPAKAVIQSLFQTSE